MTSVSYTMGRAKENENDGLYVKPHYQTSLLEIKHPVKTWTEEIGLKQFEPERTKIEQSEIKKAEIQKSEIQKSKIQHSETSEPEYLFRAAIPERYTMIRTKEWSMAALRFLQHLLSLICSRPVEASVVTIIWFVLMLATLAAKTDYPDQSSIPYVTTTLACLIVYNIASSLTPQQWRNMFCEGFNEVSSAAPGTNTWPASTPTPTPTPMLMPTPTPGMSNESMDPQLKLENVKLAKLRAKLRANRQRKRGSQILVKEQAGAIANAISKSFEQGLPKITENILSNVQRTLVDPLTLQLKNVEQELKRTSVAKQAISQQELRPVKSDKSYTSRITQLEKQNEKLSSENVRLTKEKDEASREKTEALEKYLLMKEKVKLRSDEESLHTENKKIQSRLEESKKNLDTEKLNTLGAKKELDSVTAENKRVLLLLKQTEDRLKVEESRTEKEQKSIIEEKSKALRLLKEANESLDAQKVKAKRDVDSLMKEKDDVLMLLKAKTEELEAEKATSKQYKEQVPKDKASILKEAKEFVDAQTLAAQNLVTQKDQASLLAVTTAQKEKDIVIQNLKVQLENEKREHLTTKQANAALAKKQHEIDARRRKEKKHRARLIRKHKAGKRVANTPSSTSIHPSTLQPGTQTALTQDEGMQQGKLGEESQQHDTSQLLENKTNLPEEEKKSEKDSQEESEGEEEEEREVLDILWMVDKLRGIWEGGALDDDRDQGGKLAAEVMSLLEQAEQAPPDAIPSAEKTALREKLLEFLQDAEYWRSLSFANLNVRDTRNALLTCMERLCQGRALRPTMPLRKKARA